MGYIILGGDICCNSSDLKEVVSRITGPDTDLCYDLFVELREGTIHDLLAEWGDEMSQSYLSQLPTAEQLPNSDTQLLELIKKIFDSSSTFSRPKLSDFISFTAYRFKCYGREVEVKDLSSIQDMSLTLCVDYTVKREIKDGVSLCVRLGDGNDGSSQDIFLNVCRGGVVEFKLPMIQADGDCIISLVADFAGASDVIWHKTIEIHWEVGDYYHADGKRGVVCEVDSNGRHGKIISLNETLTDWSTAVDWCRSLGKSWYMPNKKELMTIHKSLSRINETLRLKGVAIHDGWYWSSSRDYMFTVCIVNLNCGITLNLKSSYRFVRAVSAF